MNPQHVYICDTGKWSYLRMCLAIVLRSTVCPELGSVTGSLISVPMIASRNSSGASAMRSSSDCCCTDSVCDKPSSLSVIIYLITSFVPKTKHKLGKCVFSTTPKIWNKLKTENTFFKSHLHRKSSSIPRSDDDFCAYPFMI